ncbi:rhodanese-like domain-containing protein [Puniceibacterium sediminis]|uniref:Rhodanese-related sulfurtransferase n=1 Tax=Puniceibacterium sediminis TaxID=1608407 RepID=A0A238YUT7_9RHOB|nr:rhodanese-like domain-containing protein [Puniceibacterium sediminis]SNR74481.1 Rhodanese-related sulfurtransferase [Puniceibacterium sediminis]
MNMDQLRHYQAKLAYEMDSFDVYTTLEKGNKPITIVDGRSDAAYQVEHIPGAINIPHREICVHRTADLDPGRIYVCYCDGIGCNASTKTALKLMTLGFEVRELIGGLDWWIRDGYATEGTKARTGTEIICGC